MTNFRDLPLEDYLTFQSEGSTTKLLQGPNMLLKRSVKGPNYGVAGRKSLSAAGFVSWIIVTNVFI